MRLLIIIVVLFSGFSAHGQSAEGSARATPDFALPDDPGTESAREAYNAGRFNEAGRLFRELARRFPENPAIYRAMARAFSWAKEHRDAVIAYRQYLAMAPSAEDVEKVRAELDLSSKKVSPLPPPGPPPEIAQAVEAIEVRAKAGRFTGTEGAFGALDTVLSSTWVGPELATARRQVGRALVRHSEDALDRWWSPASRVEAGTVAELSLAWEGLYERLLKSKIAPAGAEIKMRGAIEALAFLADGDAVRTLRALESIGGQDHRLRFVQVLALMKLKRTKEAIQISTGLARHNKDPRILFILGLAQRRAGKKDESIESLVEAMEMGATP